MGRGDLATQWRAQAERTGAAVNATLWDEEAGAYREIAGRQAHPHDANSMAIITGVAGPDRAQRILDFFESELRTPYGAVAVDGPTGTAVPHYISPFVASHELPGLHRRWRPTPTGDGRCCGAPGDTCWRATPRALSGRHFSGRRLRPRLLHVRRATAGRPRRRLPDHTRPLGVQPTGPGFATFDVLPRPSRAPDLGAGRGADTARHDSAAWSRRGSAASCSTVEAPPGDVHRGRAGAPRPQVVRRRRRPRRCRAERRARSRLDGLTSASTVRVTPDQARTLTMRSIAKGRIAAGRRVRRSR